MPRLLIGAIAAVFLLSCAAPRTPAARASAARTLASSTPAPKPAATSSGAALAGRVFVVEPVDGLGLYPDQARASLVAVAAWARRSGFHVVDPAKTWQVLSRARAGLSATTGVACGEPLPSSVALTRWQPVLGANARLSPKVRCSKQGCVLTVHVAERIGVSADVVRFEAPYERTALEPTALAAALAHLAPKPIMLGAFSPDALGGCVGSTVSLEGVLQSTVSRPRAPYPERFGWDLTPLRVGGGIVNHGVTKPGGDVTLASVLPGGTAKLRACFGANDDETYLRFTAGVDGRVTHCEAAYEIDGVDACACRVLSADARLPASMHGDRFEADLQLEAAETVTPDGYIVSGSTETYLDTHQKRCGGTLLRTKVTDPSIHDWSPPPSSAVNRCFADVRGATDRNIRVQIRFDADGRAIGVRITGSDGPRLTQAEATCLRSALLGSRAPCPATSAPVATGEVQVSFLPTPKTAHAH